MTLSLTRNQPHKLPKAATCRVAMCQLDKQVPVDLENSKSKWISSSPTVRLVGAVLFSVFPFPGLEATLIYALYLPWSPGWPPSLQCSTLSTKYHFKLQLLQSSREMNPPRLCWLCPEKQRALSEVALGLEWGNRVQTPGPLPH